MEYVFIINPVAGKCDRSEELIPQIQAAAKAAEIPAENLHIHKTEYKGHAAELARQAAEKGGPVQIYTAGGDGTFNEALCGVLGCKNAAVGLLPYGSGNDFLRSFGTREEFLDVEGQLRGGVMPIDLIKTQRGYAAAICSAGLDAQVAYGIPAFRRIPLCGGEMAYKLSLLKQLTGKRGHRLAFTIDGKHFEEDCLMVAVCNGHAYGGGFIAAPEAKLDDGILDVLVVRDIPFRTILKAVPKYQKGEHFRNGAIIPELSEAILYYPAHEVEIHLAQCTKRPLIVNVDGECGPDDTLYAHVEPLAARILLPEAVFARQKKPAVSQ